MNNEKEDFSDVILPTATIEQVEVAEFEFDNGLWCLRQEGHHWEIQFQSEKGEESIIVEEEDFIDGKLIFDIDNEQHTLLLEDFNRIIEFVNASYKK